jgi:demethylmenaquinone methyltransferase/2-methoxy-6-polyprenyl-1,4-benzoquinol methylase
VEHSPTPLVPLQHVADKEKVRAMFNDIAPRYDFLNSFLSGGIHKLWKKRLIRTIAAVNPLQILDVASGTCDLAIMATRLHPERIVALDLSEQMLAIGKQKIVKKKLSHLIETVLADAEHIPFEDSTFDAAMVGYGVRNFAHPVEGMREILRILKPGALFCVLEFSKPRKTPIKQLYRFYFTKWLPLVGKLVSRNQSAYNYLPNSVGGFAEGAEFVKLMTEAGFSNVKYQYLSMGITCLYSGYKI